MKLPKNSFNVAHEAPMCFMPLVQKHTDYDYALVHLFEQVPEYFNYFENAIKSGRHVLLDNSIFELGVAFNSDKYAEHILKLQPTEYIIPDALEEVCKTEDQFHDWMSKYSDLPGEKIAVLQGKNMGDLFHLLTLYIDSKINKIAVSFDYSFYKMLYPHPNKWISCMMGRLLTIGLIDDFINYNFKLAEKQKIHLLGASNPEEFRFYPEKYDAIVIKSVDTSSPVLHAITDTPYNIDVISKWEKNTLKINDIFNNSWDEDTKNNINNRIVNNIQKFKSFLAR